MIDDVVAVLRAGRGLQNRAGIEIGDPQVGEIARNVRRGVEGEILVQLHPIGGDGLAGSRQLDRNLVEQATGPLSQHFPFCPHRAPSGF